MVDMMNLRQSYKKREITEVKQIHRQHNPADSMTKTNPSSNLKMLIDSNLINIRTTESVERAGMKEATTDIGEFLFRVADIAMQVVGNAVL